MLCGYAWLVMYACQHSVEQLEADSSSTYLVLMYKCRHADRTLACTNACQCTVYNFTYMY